MGGGGEAGSGRKFRSIIQSAVSLWIWIAQERGRREPIAFLADTVASDVVTVPPIICYCSSDPRLFPCRLSRDELILFRTQVENSKSWGPAATEGTQESLPGLEVSESQDAYCGKF